MIFDFPNLRTLDLRNNPKFDGVDSIANFSLQTPDFKHLKLSPYAGSVVNFSGLHAEKVTNPMLSIVRWRSL